MLPLQSVLLPSISHRKLILKKFFPIKLAAGFPLILLSRKPAPKQRDPLLGQ